MTLQKIVLDRLLAGSLVIVVEEADEILAIAACEMAGRANPPGKVQRLSVLDPEFMDKFTSHKEGGNGVMIVADFLRVMGTNPAAIRLVREFALQTKAPPYPRLILVESPGVDIPASLKNDVEIVRPKLANLDELKQELDEFVKVQGIKLEGNGENRHGIALALAGVPRHTAAKMLAQCLVALKKLDSTWLRKAKAERITEQFNGALSFVDTDSVDVGGNESLVGWLKLKSKEFASEKAKKYGLEELKGLLLTGVPGTGKSLFVRYAARVMGLPLLRLDIGKVFGKYVGDSEAAIRLAIEAAEACSPCVLWIDEVDKGLGGMKEGGGGDSGTSLRVLGTILTWLQEKTKPVFVLATANNVTRLPDELMRKGRFDEVFFVDLPTAKEREDIARIHIERRGRKAVDYDLKVIADATNNFGGAEIEQAIKDGMTFGYAEDREFTVADIKRAAEETYPLAEMMKEGITKLREWAKGRTKMAGARQDAVPEGGSFSRRIKIDLTGGTPPPEAK